MSPWNKYVYILSNKNRTTFYIGVTGNLQQRIFAHKAGVGSKFCKRYNLNELLYFEEFEWMNEAIEEEKRLKNWHRDWKLNLIKQKNPQLVDLAKEWFTLEEINERKVRVDQ